MHTRASNSELVEPLPESERTLNRRLRRRNRRVPFEQRNKPPAQPRIFYALILDINYFSHFLDIFENYNPMDDEPMWAADCVIAPTPGSAITIPETVNEFTIKETPKMKPFADKQSTRPSGSLPSNTQPNPKGSSSKPYQPPDDEDEEPTPQPKVKNPKPVKEIPIPKPYKPKIPYPQRLRKEKMEAQYGKLLDMIRAIRTNVPLVDVLV
ncbi:hypothetical protein Tco_0627721 [Tanacetum coccineum]|uniref:Uncharacterized protein n=1 Tax=Tanacetum coccineum TaxID=301880 RepID=A0ABQ4WN90_9ASTR